MTGLTFSTAYYFQVVASNVGGTGGTVATGSTITTGVAPPNVPAAPAVAPVNDGTTTKLTVTWSAPAPDSTHAAATGYNLQWRTSPSGTWNLVSGVRSGTVIGSLSAGTAYDVQIQATNASAGSPSGWSGTTTATTYSTALVFGAAGQGTSLAPTSPVSHSGSWSGGGLNFAATSPLSHPSGMTGWIVYDTQNVTVPSTGNGHSTSMSAIWTSTYANYLSPPLSAGTWYVWAVLTTSATAGSGTVSAALVSSAITVT